MLRRDVRLVFTPAYEVTKHSTGTTITDRFSGREVYLQPGDDEMLFLIELEELEERETDTEENVNRLCEVYFNL